MTWHLGRWIRTTDWYPDDQLRLYDRRAAQWTGQYVHESVSVTGTVGRLAGELQHYPYRNIADHLETIDRYTTLAARQMHESGRRAGLLQIAGHPPLAFLRNYILRGGFRDGVPGLIISSLNAYYVFLKFAKLWQLQHIGPAASNPAESLDGRAWWWIDRAASRATRARQPYLSMFSLHIDTARTWRGGQNQVLLTVNGLGEAGQRAALVAHPDGELRRRAREGLELIPIAARTEVDLTAGWRLSRVIKRLRPRRGPRARSPRHRDGGAGAVLRRQQGRAGARRLTPGRFPPQGATPSRAGSTGRSTASLPPLKPSA